MFSTGKTGWKCPTAVREPGYLAAGSSPQRNPKAPKILPQKRAPEGALKWFCGARFGKPGKRLDEAGKSQLTPRDGVWPLKDSQSPRCHPTFVTARPKTPSPSAALGAGGASTRKRKFNHQIPIKPRKKQGGGGKSGGSWSPDPSAPIFLALPLFQRVFQREVATAAVLVATISGCSIRVHPCPVVLLVLVSHFPNPASQPGSTTPGQDAPSIHGILGNTTSFSWRWVLWEAWEPLSNRGYPKKLKSLAFSSCFSCLSHPGRGTGAGFLLYQDFTASLL